MSQLLFNLVKSLSIREKAHFIRFTNIYSDDKKKNYLRLYHMLEDMSQYDLKKLKSSFEKDNISKQISSESDYLLKKLLKSLVNFHFDKTYYSELVKRTLFIDILLNKGFQKKALKDIYKTKKIAYLHEEFSVILKLIQQEENVLFKEGILNFTKKLNELSIERQSVALQIQNLNELRLLREQARELQYTEVFIDTPERFPHIFANPIMESESNALSKKAKEHWLYVYEIRFYLTRNFKEGLKASAIYLDFMEANTHLIKKSKMLSTISNYLYNSALVVDQKTFMHVLSKLEKILIESPNDSDYIHFIKYIRLFELYYQTRNFSAADELVKVAGVFLRDKQLKIEETQVNYLFFLIVRAFLESNNFEEASNWLHSWNQTKQLKNTLIHNRLFSMIIYFELGWNDLLSTEIDTSYKLLKRHKKYDKLANSFFTFFKKYLKETKRLTSYLVELEKKLSIIKIDSKSNKAFIYYDYWNWCHRRLHKLIPPSDKVS